MKYTVKPTKKQLKRIRLYWKTLQQIISDFDGNIHILESFMEQDTKIDGIEFFRNDFGEYAGVGTIDRRMKLWQPRR